MPENAKKTQKVDAQGIRHLGRSDEESVGSAISNAKLSYDDLTEIFGADASFGSRKEFRSSELHDAAKRLTAGVYPIRESKFDKSWASFYIPLKAETPTLLPMHMARYRNADRDEYFVYLPLYFNQIRILRGERHRPGMEGLASEKGMVLYHEPYDKRVETVFQEANRMLKVLTSLQQVKRYVPYEYRKGRIKRRYFSSDEEKFIQPEEAKRIKDEYKAYSKRKLSSERVSLNGYLRVAAICYAGAFKETGNPKELYESHSDFRRAGMLEIKDYDSVKEFSDFVASDVHSGSHPFEIISGARNGIHLFPPTERHHAFTLSSSTEIYAEQFIQALTALMKEGIAVEEGGLDEALRYLSGDTYYRINSDPSAIDWLELDEESKKQIMEHAVWDKLTLARKE